MTPTRRRRAHNQHQLPASSTLKPSSLSSCGCNHKCSSLLVTSLTMAIGIMQVCVAMAQNDNGNNDNNDNEKEAQIDDETQQITPAPTNSPPTQMPTMSPTDQPTFSPTLTFAPTSSPTVPAHVAESATWASIRVTAMVSALTMVALITLFEVGRRSHTLRDIFDRKRETRPGRTPPKLLSGAGMGPLGWLKYVGEYLFVDGYVYKEYRDYAQRIQEDNEMKDEERARLRRERSKSPRSSPRWGSRHNSISSSDGDEPTVRSGDAAAGDDSLTLKDRGESGSENAPPEERATAEAAGFGSGIVSLMTGVFARSVSSSSPSRDESNSSRNGSNSADAEESITKDVEANDTTSSLEALPATSFEVHCVESKPAASNITPKKLSISTKDPITSSKRKVPSRWRYFCVRPGSCFGSLFNYTKQKEHGPLSPRHIRELTSWTSATGGTADGSAPSDDQLPWSDKILRYVPVLQPLELTKSDRELLRCIGLDSYVMIRFLRLGFEMTSWPFLVACVSLIPLYYTNDYKGTFGQVTSESSTGFSTTTTTGYFRITINRLDNGNPKIWIVWIYAACYFLVLLRRLWVEWLVFIELREDFLANGDKESMKEDDAESLKQFRNSCIVEYVPSSHRRDRDMFLFFDSLFPGQVKRAEIIVQTQNLTSMIQKRQRFIASYEAVKARQVHEDNEYRREMELIEAEGEYKCGCKRRVPKQPETIQIRSGGGMCCLGGSAPGEMVDALPYYQSEIERMNELIEAEYARIVQKKEDAERYSVLGSTPTMKMSSSTTKKSSPSSLKRGTMEKYLTKVFLPHEVANSGSDDCGNGFVEFKTRAAKQAALQCILSSRANYFATEQAPDVRDILWNNMPLDRRTIQRRYVIVQCFLLIGILFWSAIVGAIGNIETAVASSGIEISPTLLGFVAGYLPVLILIILMATIPSIFTLLAVRVIRFRSRSEADRFVLKWNYLYRIANFCVILVSGTLYNTLLSATTNPDEVIESIANGVLVQSQFFFNAVMTAIGTGTSLQISQLWTVLYWLIVKHLITEEAMSERKLEQMKVPKDFIFGRFTAEFVWVYMIAMVYSAMVPLITGACAVYFYLASKIYTHQALFIFSQRYEGGGKLFYSLNRTVFVLIYVSIIIFGTVLALKDRFYAAASFVVLMMYITYTVDGDIHSRFSVTSQKLPLTRARIIDEEYASLLGDKKAFADVKARREEASEILSIEEEPSSGAPVDRRKAFMNQKAAKTFRHLNTSGVGMGIGLPSLTKGGQGAGHELDFYLYRQPDLHKQTWETSPRPYRLEGD